MAEAEAAGERVAGEEGEPQAEVLPLRLLLPVALPEAEPPPPPPSPPPAEREAL